MALKGTTKIELTNVKTGQKEVIEKDNLVTNAVADVMQMNPFAHFSYSGYNSNYYYTESQMFPICPNLVGGILLYENALEEDPDKYYAQYDNPLVGYASNNVNNTEEVMRGDMNVTESGPLEDGSGYRFVFDFATSQANGTISAVGLTHKYGGVEGYGSDKVSTYKAGQFRIWPAPTYNLPATTADERSRTNSIRMIDPENNLGYGVRLISNNLISVSKFRISFNSVPLVGNNVNPSILAESIIETEVFGASYATYNYITFINDGEGYIWGLQHNNNTNGNSSGDAIINWIKIDPKDCSFEEGTWTIPLQLNRFGYEYSENALKSFRLYESLIYKGHLYCYSYQKDKIYSINLANITDVKTFTFDDGNSVYPSYSSYRQQSTLFNVIGNVVVFLGGYIIGDKAYAAAPSVQDNYPTRGIARSGCPNLHYGPFLVNIRKSTYNDGPADISCELMTPYLATINNLPTPVQKTADKTMKITYILREE